MHLSSSGLPSRLPVGATYVVEGYRGEEGKLQVVARYVVLPDGQRINVPAEPFRTPAPRALTFRRRAKAKRSQPKSRPAAGRKKIAARRGTGYGGRR
jgi:hypothetical protein